MDHSLWGHLPLLVRANSKESVEYILEALWRTRNTGLDAADRHIICDMLQLPNESDLDPLLVCLRTLMRRCVHENINKDEIHKLFPNEVLPELQRLLTLMLQKFQKEWREDVQKDQPVQVNLPRLKAMTWNMANQDMDLTDPVAVINLKLQNDAQSNAGDTDLKFQLAKGTLDTMLRSMSCIRDQLSDDHQIDMHRKRQIWFSPDTLNWKIEMDCLKVGFSSVFERIRTQCSRYKQSIPWILTVKIQSSGCLAT